MIEAVDAYLARVGRMRLPRAVEPRVVCESEPGLHRPFGAEGAIPMADVQMAQRAAGRLLGTRDLARDPGKLFTCPICHTGPGRECPNGRHTERDVAEQAHRLAQRAIVEAPCAP